MMSLLIPALLASSPVPAVSQLSSSPPTPCGQGLQKDNAWSADTASVVRLAQDWVTAINTVDDAAFVRFVRERGPELLDGPERWLELRNMIRGIRLCGVKSVSLGMVELWSFDATMDSYAIMYLVPAKGASDRIAFNGVMLSDEVPPGAVLPTPLTKRALIKAVGKRAARFEADGRFSGAVLLARNRHVLFQQAYGLADRVARTPNTLNTQFRFGSIGKMFTAVAVMQLVQTGKVDLLAPVGRYLPGYPNRDIATKVTVAQLLSHTGGTGDIFGPEFDRNRAKLRDLTDYVTLYGARAPESVPGSSYAYSNYGFVLLGRIVEQVSGLSYADYVRRRVFEPAGMTSTGNLPESIRLPRRAVGYIGQGSDLRSVADTLPFSGTSAGGGYSTVGDFERFARALTNHRLLNEATLHQLTTGGVRLPNGELARFDFGSSLPGGGRYIGHTGGAPGISGAFYHFVSSGYTVAVLANRDPGTAESVALFAAHRLPGNAEKSQP